MWYINQGMQILSQTTPSLSRVTHRHRIVSSRWGDFAPDSHSGTQVPSILWLYHAKDFSGLPWDFCIWSGEEERDSVRGELQSWYGDIEVPRLTGSKSSRTATGC